MDTHPRSNHRGPRWRFTVIIALMAALAPFSTATYLPSFPDIIAELHATPLQVQQTLSVYLAAFGLMMLVYGPLSDAWGRKRLAIGALIGYIFASIGCALAVDIHGLILLRLAQGLTGGAGLVIGQAMIRDLLSGPQAQRLMANVMMAFGLAPALAPIIGGVLHEAWGWRSVFWFLALLSTGIVWLAWRWLPETLPPANRQSIRPRALTQAYLKVFRHRRFLLLVSAAALNFGGMYLYIASAPVLLIDMLGFTPGEFSWFFIPVVIGMMVGTFNSRQQAGKRPPRQIIALAYIVAGVAALINVLQALFLPLSAIGAIAPVVLYAAGLSLAMPAFSLLALDEFPQNRGLAAAVQSAFQMGMTAIVAGVFSPLLSAHVITLALGMLVLTVLSFGIWWFSLPPPQR